MCISKQLQGHLVAQLVNRLTFDFGSGHNLTVCGFEPCIRLCSNSAEPAWDSLPLSPPLPCSLSLSQKINEKKTIFENYKLFYVHEGEEWDIIKK